jgi:hypothetical protein
MNANTVTFEQVEQLALQLPPPEQLKLVAYLSEQLSGLLKVIQPLDTKLAQQKREAMADALLAELDTIAESIEGQFDAAEDIRQIREERMNRL